MDFGKACRKKRYTRFRSTGRKASVCRIPSARQGCTPSTSSEKHINTTWSTPCPTGYATGELILPAGDYKLNLTCEDAQGELVVFVRDREGRIMFRRGSPSPIRQVSFFITVVTFISSVLLSRFSAWARTCG